jgi:DUF2075 family protein
LVRIASDAPTAVSDGDICWRGDKWLLDADQAFERGFDRNFTAARREVDSDGPHHVALYIYIAQGYRILLTRPMRGTLVWVEDKETRM